VPSLQDTAYPRLKHNITDKELATIYTPTLDELSLAEQHTKGSSAKLNFLILLKTFQRLGYAVALASIPARIVQHIAASTQVSTSLTELANYDASGTRKRHLLVIRDYLHLHPFDTTAQAVTVTAMETAAMTKHDLVDLVNIAIEELVHQRFELPAFSQLLRLAHKARTLVTNKFFKRITDSLSESERRQIDALFQADSDTGKTLWNEVKRETGKPTITHLKELVERLHWLAGLQISTAALNQLPSVKRKHFAEEAKALDAPRMKQMSVLKRYTLAVALLNAQYARTLDDLAEMFIRQMQQMHHRGKEALTMLRQETQARTDTLIATLRDVVAAFQGEGEIAQRFADIETVIGDQGATILEDCDAHLAYVGNNYFPLLQTFYKSQRSALFRLLDVLPLRSSTQDVSLIEAIKFIVQNRHSRSASVSVVRIEHPGTDEERHIQLLDLSWIPQKWWTLVSGQRKRTPYPSTLQRRPFEVCVFSHLLLGLKSGDLYIEGSWEFGDYGQQLISWEQYKEMVSEYGKQLGLPTEPSAFVTHLQQWLENTAQATDAGFPANVDVDYQKDRLVIRKPKAKIVQGVATLKALIAQRLAPVNLLDVLADTELWLNWTQFFKPKSGHDAKLDKPAVRYVASTFCYGCNLGPTQATRSLKGFDRKQVAYAHQHHIDTDKLQAANATIINAYNRFSLPKLWGDGKRASVDGTKWDIYEDNLLAEYHIRYGGYGGIGYYHVSDTYIALFSHFIPCGVWEAVYLLDGLLNNTSEIQPDTIHGDTQSQSATVFALAYLLGIQLMPRIRNWKDLILYRSCSTTHYSHIDPLFSETVNWKLIETHLPDMLRVALSIKAGKIAASTILRKLGTNSSQNKLYRAFHELGCAVRTGFLLQYIHDADLRATIQAATNKSEAFNGFAKWLSFGGEGVIATNNREEQRKVIKYNHLIANCLIFYNVFEMSRILQELILSGYPVEPEAVAALSPYWTHHVNRFGIYDLNLDRCPPTLDFDTVIIPATTS
jgi:TnpA family transposase